MMTGLLYINEVDAFVTYGAFLAENTAKDWENFSELLRPSKMKAYTAVSYREENGERLPDVLPTPAFEARDFTLHLALIADTPVQYARQYEALMQMLTSGWLTLRVRGINRTFKVYYKECVAYEPLTPQDDGQVVCRMSLKFREPTPSY